MPRDHRAYLADIIDSCRAIQTAVAGLDLAGYSASRLVRSSVEREFIIIGDAIAARSRVGPWEHRGDYERSQNHRLPQPAHP